MNVLGHWLVLCSLLAAAGSATMYFRATSMGRSALALPRRLLQISLASLSLASILLLSLLLTHDFSNGYVYSYSDRSLPLHYLISTFYAGQEGSFLFWALCSAVIAIFLRRHSGRANVEAWVMTVYMALVTWFILLVAAKSPFRSLAEMFPAAATMPLPADGRGLNPLLKNFWMVIHPPVLFLGFAGMAVPFSFAIGGFWKKDYTLLASRAIPWVLFTSAILGLGIMLGAYWAYGVLGWGGYWGWDPVENSSLVPWIMGIALLHTLLVQLRTGKYVRTNFVLAVVSFMLVVYSTFLTRSGVLGDASVHAFTDPGATTYWLLLVFLAAIGVVGFLVFFVRRLDLRTPEPDQHLLTRETSLAAGSLALALSAAVILFGTSLPIFSTTRVEPSFYNVTQLPIAIAIGLLIGFSLYSQWELSDGRAILRRSAKMLAASVLVTGILFAMGLHNLLVLLFVFSALFALLVNVETAVKVARGNWRFIGGKIAHAGIAVFLAGVVCSGKFATLERIALPLNTPTAVLGRTLIFTGYKAAPDGKLAFTVKVVEDSASSFELSPVIFDAGEQGLMRTPDIASSLTRDFYVSAIQYEQSDQPSAQETYTIEKGRPIAIGRVEARLIGFDMDRHDRPPDRGTRGMAVGSILEFSSGSDRERIVPVAIYQEGHTPEARPTASRLMNAEVVLVGMNVGSGSTPSSVTVNIQHQNAKAATGGMLVVEASVKPLISFVWGGTLIIMLGFSLSVYKRWKEA